MNDRYLNIATRWNLITPAYAAQVRAWLEGQPTGDARQALLDGGLVSPEQDAAILQAMTAERGDAVDATRADAQADQTHGDTFSNQATLLHSDGGAEPNTVDMRGRFTPVRMLGRGGMGLVVLHRDGRLLREVAVKQLTRVDAPFAAERFVVEAQVTGQLEHPNIVPVYELDEGMPGRPAMVMKCVRGRHLQSVLSDIARNVPLPADLVGDAATDDADPQPAAEQRDRVRPGTRGRATARSNRTRARTAAPTHDSATTPTTPTLPAALALPRLLEVFDKVCDAIAYAHARGVVHRDLKPENIMVGRFGEVLVMDWGLAKELGGDAPSRRWSKRDDEATALQPVRTLRASHPESSDLMRTVDGTIAGTPMYMSPEQAEGRIDDVDRRSDLYSLGAILYSILTANAPFSADNVYQLLAQVSRGDVRPPHRNSRAPWRIPAELEAIALKAMARVPAMRYQHVTELQADLRAYRASLPITAHRDGPIRAIAKWSKRHPIATVSAGVATVFTLVLALVITVLVGRTAEADARAAAVAAQLDAAEARRQALEAEKREADLVADQAELKAERARLAEYALRGEVDALVAELGGKLTYAFERRVEELLEQRARALADGLSDEAFIGSLGAERLQSILDDFQRLFDAHDRYPDRIAVEAKHYFYRGLIRVVAFDQLREAADDFTRALQLDPQAVQPLNNRGLVRMKLGQHALALDDFDRVIDLEPTASAYLHRASARLALNRVRDALADADAAVALNDADDEAFGFRAEIKLRQGDAAGALDDADRALALREDVAINHITRGVALQSLGRDAESIPAYTRAIELDDRAQVAYANRAAAYIALGRFDDALVDVNLALQLDPRDTISLLNRAHAHIVHDNLELARDDYTAVLTIEPRNEKALNNRAYVYTRLGEYRNAAGDLDLLTRVAPGNWEAWMSYGAVLAELGLRDDARDAFDRAKMAAPAARQDEVDRRRRSVLGE